MNETVKWTGFGFLGGTAFNAAAIPYLHYVGEKSWEELAELWWVFAVFLGACMAAGAWSVKFNSEAQENN